MIFAVCQHRFKFDNFDTWKASNPLKIAATVRALLWHVELTEPVQTRHNFLLHLMLLLSTYAIVKWLDHKKNLAQLHQLFAKLAYRMESKICLIVPCTTSTVLQFWGRCLAANCKKPCTLSTGSPARNSSLNMSHIITGSDRERSYFLANEVPYSWVKQQSTVEPR